MKPLQLFAPNVIETLRRFPVPVLCSLSLFLLIIIDMSPEKSGPLSLMFICGFFSFGIARLIAEARGSKSLIEGATGIGLTVASFGLTQIGGAGDTSQLMIVSALFLAALTAPYLSAKYGDLALWQFLHKILTGFFLASVGGIVLACGLSAALKSVQYLFEIDLKYDFYIYIWYFAALVYAPFNTLTWVPQRFEADPAECRAAPGVPFILNWILAPLAFLYFLILYGYGAKILIDWELPRGNVAYMVTGFGALGILTYVAGWGLRDSGNRLLKILYRRYFVLLILPVILLFIAVGARIRDYGVTEDRYLIALAAIWFGGMAILYAIKPQAPLKTLFASLIVLVTLASFGPWGAASLSERSQIERLKDILARNGMMENGRAVPAAKPIPVREQYQLSSILDYLDNGNDNVRKEIAEFMPVRTGATDYFYAAVVMQSLNLTYLTDDKFNSPSENDAAYNERYFNAAGVNPDYSTVEGYDRFYHYFNLQNRTENEPDTVNHTVQGYHFWLQDNEIFVSDGHGQKRIVKPETLLMIASEKERGVFVIDDRIGAMSFRFTIDRAEYRDYGDGRKIFTSVTGNLLTRD